MSQEEGHVPPPPAPGSRPTPPFAYAEYQHGRPWWQGCLISIAGLVVFAFLAPILLLGACMVDNTIHCWGRPDGKDFDGVRPLQLIPPAAEPYGDVLTTPEECRQVWSAAPASATRFFIIDRKAAGTAREFYRSELAGTEWTPQVGQNGQVLQWDAGKLHMKLGGGEFRGELHQLVVTVWHDRATDDD